MLYIILIVLILGPSKLTCADEDSIVKNTSVVHKKIEENATASTAELSTTKGENVNTSNVIKIISTTPSLISSMPTSEVPQSVLPSLTDQRTSNITKIVKPVNSDLRNSSFETEQSHYTSEKINLVVTEGGTNVSTLDKTGTNFQVVNENPLKTIVAEGGLQESAGERIMPNSTAIPVSSDLDPHSVIIEGISSMNEGKIIARKGVVLDNNTMGDNEDRRTGEIVKNNSMTSGSLSHSRKHKPVVTDDNNETLSENIPKVDYVIAIVCSAFSLPLLIVLAMYLYKKGLDLWERRHYNRMDFLIEGMYND
ncbi:uncharacterized protein [Hetaerina americana]|uniref:uncharacterized protein n=1 Tax=Hetaerina americana TaxID=62018 RepID=UPI003A7F3F1E